MPSIARRQFLGDAPRAEGHGESDHEKAHQMVRADIHRIEVQRERQHHHGVLRAGRKRDGDVGNRKAEEMRIQQHKESRHRHRHRK